MGILVFGIGFFMWCFFFYQKDPRFFFFRAIASVLSISLVGMLNVNWLLGRPVSLLFLGGLIVVGAFLAFVWNGKDFPPKTPLRRMRTVYVVPIVVFVLALLLGGYYFSFQWDVFRYATPDSGTHFLYMSQTARSGMMPMFLENNTYLVSGLESMKFHQMSYFPGSTSVFYVLSQLSPFRLAETFQLFNVLFYALVCGYFFALSMHVLRGTWRYLSFGIFAFFLLCGVFFDLVVSSFSTQSLGLFFLLFFADTYSRYRSGKLSAWFSVFALSAVFVTYLYWLPVAFLYIFFERISALRVQKFSWKGFGSWAISAVWIPLGGLLLGAGYGVFVYSMHILGYASADGGFPLQKYLVRDTVLVIPFALFSFFLLLRRSWKEKEMDFVLNLSLATLTYALTLMFLYLVAKKVAHYPAFKVLYLLLPLVWILALSSMTKIFSFLKELLVRKKVTLDLVSFRRYAVLFIGLYALTALFTYANNIPWNFLPLQKQNISLARGGGGVGFNLTREQSQLLDVIDRDFRGIVKDNKILVVAPADTSLLVFAYSGIWPRPMSLVDPEKPLGTGMMSPMEIGFPGIANYGEWFERDPDRILVYFKTKESKRWIVDENFPLD